MGRKLEEEWCSLNHGKLPCCCSIGCLHWSWTESLTLWKNLRSRPSKRRHVESTMMWALVTMFFLMHRRCWGLHVEKFAHETIVIRSQGPFLHVRIIALLLKNTFQKIWNFFFLNLVVHTYTYMCMHRYICRLILMDQESCCFKCVFSIVMYDAF